MSKRLTVLTAAAALVAAQTFAGMYYEATTTASGRKGAEMINTTVHGWVAGDAAKVVFESSNNPMAKKGMYMLSKDGGKSVYMVNPEDKNYFKWDVDALVGMAGGMMKMMNMKYADVKMEKVGEEAGGTVAGLPTIHYTYHSSYTMSMKFLMMHKTSKVTRVQEIWSAPRLLDAALGMYLRKTPPSMGDEEYDRMVRAQTEAIKGFPLRMHSVQTDTDEKGKSETTTTVMEVTKLELEFATPASTFEIPAGYEEVNTPTMPGMK